MSKYAALYDHPSGPGDARPTAQRIVEDEGLVGKLSGKVALVTGANQGIGFETARALWMTGATVYLAVRHTEKGERVIREMRALDPSNEAPLHVVELALDSLASIRDTANTFLSQNKSLNILVLNAGIMATPHGKTVDGFEMQLGVNHLGHFLLFHMLKPALLAAATPAFHSRVISVSSMGHRLSEVRFHDLNFERDSYDPMIAYGQSKTANIYLANEIERRYARRGLHGLSVHPGVVQTNLGKHLDPKMLEQMMDDQFLRSIKSPSQGASTTVYAALSKDWEGRGGRYLSDCVEQGPVDPNATPFTLDPGYAPWAYDEEKAVKLWNESCKLVGLKEED